MYKWLTIYSRRLDLQIFCTIITLSALRSVEVEGSGHMCKCMYISGGHVCVCVCIIYYKINICSYQKKNKHMLICKGDLRGESRWQANKGKHVRKSHVLRQYHEGHYTMRLRNLDLYCAHLLASPTWSLASNRTFSEYLFHLAYSLVTKLPMSVRH